jgi:hypothetical protein
LLNRGGQAMSELPVGPAASPGAPLEIDMPLAGLAPASTSSKCRPPVRAARPKSSSGFA